MALFGKDRERSDRPRAVGPAPAESPPSAAPREVEMFEREREKPHPEETAATSAFLGKGSRVTGKLAFEGTVRIEGHVEGEITAQDTLTIGESAVVNAQINGSSIIVNGKVTGDITARKRLEIRSPGKVYGNISAPSLVIHEGVIFEGQCTMSPGEGTRAEKDRKVAFFPKDDRAGDGVLKAHSEIAK
jgi:cytoskeletal protein CcmA (bactofilin family)